MLSEMWPMPELDCEAYCPSAKSRCRSIKEPGSQYCPVPQCPDPPRRRHHRRHRMHRRHLAMDGTVNGTTNEGGNEEEELVMEGNMKGKIEGEKEEGGCIGPMGLIAIVPLNALMLIGGILLVQDGLKQFRIPSSQ